MNCKIIFIPLFYYTQYFKNWLCLYSFWPKLIAIFHTRSLWQVKFLVKWIMSLKICFLFTFVFFKIVTVSNSRKMELTESVKPKKTSPKISSIIVVNQKLTVLCENITFNRCAFLFCFKTSKKGFICCCLLFEELYRLREIPHRYCTYLWCHVYSGWYVW